MALPSVRNCNTHFCVFYAYFPELHYSMFIAKNRSIFSPPLRSLYQALADIGGTLTNVQTQQLIATLTIDVWAAEIHSAKPVLDVDWSILYNSNYRLLRREGSMNRVVD